MATEAAGWNQEDGTVQETLRATAYPTFALRSAKKRHAKQKTTKERGDEMAERLTWP